MGFDEVGSRRSVTEPTEPPRPAVGGSGASRRLIWAHVLSDAAALIVALGLAALARFGLGWLAFTENPDLSWTPYVAAGVLWVAAVLRGFAARGLYDEDTLTPGGGEMARAWQAIIEGVAVIAIAAFLIRGEQLSRSWFLMTVLLSAVLVPAERVGFRKVLAGMRERGRWRRTAILIAGNDAPTLPERLGEFDIVRRTDADAFLDTVAGEAEATARPDEVVLVDANAMDEDTLWEVVLAAGQRGSSVFVMSRLREVTTQRLTMRGIAGVAFVRVLPPRISGIRAVQKRALDLVVAVVATPFALVLSVIIAGLGLVTAGRPILYGQDRLGVDGRVFRMWKFRSMAVDAESETGPVWTVEDDPRRTPLGRFLRRWSLDELPQLWSVLRGEMSMVGPRPERPELAERFDAENRWYRYRLRIKPGMTGSAQAQGFRGPTSLEARLELDNLYIENWSLGLDLQILAQTVVVVLRGTNAE
jgi:exopolysaccharide biosynthesis polyprenyl glycosylphosphotransferase